MHALGIFTHPILLVVIGDAGTEAKAAAKPFETGRRGEGLPRSDSPRGRAWVFPFIEWPKTCESSNMYRVFAGLSIGEAGMERAVDLERPALPLNEYEVDRLRGLRAHDCSGCSREGEVACSWCLFALMAKVEVAIVVINVQPLVWVGRSWVRIGSSTASYLHHIYCREQEHEMRESKNSL